MFKRTLACFCLFSYALVLIIRHLHIDFLLDPLSDVIDLGRFGWFLARQQPWRCSINSARRLRRKRLPRFARKCSCALTGFRRIAAFK